MRGRKVGLEVLERKHGKTVDSGVLMHIRVCFLGRNLNLDVARGPTNWNVESS